MTLSRRGLVGAGVGVALAAPRLARAAEPVRGGTLVATWGGFEPQALFVPGGGGSSPEFSSTKIIERLVSIGSDQTFRPALATAWSHSADFREHRVVLRPGVTWHDGRPMTVDDVVFSMTQYWRPITSPVALKRMVGAEAVGPDTVAMRFSEPTPEFLFLSLLAGQGGGVLPKHIYGTGEILTNPMNNTPVGTGPWKYKTWARGSHIEYERNEAYWDAGKPYWDKLILRYFRDPGARAAAMEAGELQLGVFNPIAPPDIRRLTRANKVVATTRGYENTLWQLTLEMNTRSPVVNRREVRQALWHAIDRAFIANTIFYGYAKPARSLISQNNRMFFTDDVPQYPFDPKKAAALLDAAGLPRKADGKRFTVRLVAAGWFGENGKAGQYIKQALEDVGVGVDLAIPDRPTSLKRIYTDYDYDLAISNNSNPAEPTPYTTQYLATDGIVKGAAFRNATGYSDPGMDALIDRIASEADVPKRVALVHELQRRAMTEMVYAPLVDMDSVTVSLPGFAGLDATGNVLGDSWSGVWRAAGS